MTADRKDIASDIVKLAASGLFEFDWYVGAHAGALPEDVDPMVFFCKTGWRRGDNPNALFDTAKYLALNLDVREAGINPIVHYLGFGEAEGRRPYEDFDPAWYRLTYEVPDHVNCLADHLRRRRSGQAGPVNGLVPVTITIDAAAPEAETIRSSGLLDPLYYREAGNIAPDADPVEHFCRFGWRAHRNPNPVFKTAWYLAANDDVRRAGVNPLCHYILYGEAEGRAPSDAFDPRSYRALHGLGPEESPLRHYLSHPALMNATASPADDAATEMQLLANTELFDINYYLANYPDVRQSDLDPAVHFLTYGWKEGRRPNPYFDPAWYINTYLSPAERGNPLLHYIRFGERAGNRPIVYFDPTWYSACYGLNGNKSPLEHFLENRRSQYYSPIKSFDVAWYIGKYGANIGKNRDPFAHYLRVGMSGEVDPSPTFDAKRYRLNHMEHELSRPRPVPGAEIQDKLRREALHPFVHYLLRESLEVTRPVALSA